MRHWWREVVTPEDNRVLKVENVYQIGKLEGQEGNWGHLWREVNAGEGSGVGTLYAWS